MISSHEPTAPEVVRLLVELAAAKAERADLAAEVDALRDRAERAWAAQVRCHKQELRLLASLEKAEAALRDVTALRDLMARRADRVIRDDYTIPALVTADGVAGALTAILNAAVQS